MFASTCHDFRYLLRDESLHLKIIKNTYGIPSLNLDIMRRIAELFGFQELKDWHDAIEMFALDGSVYDRREYLCILYQLIKSPDFFLRALVNFSVARTHDSILKMSAKIDKYGFESITILEIAGVYNSLQRQELAEASKRNTTVMMKGMLARAVCNEIHNDHACSWPRDVARVGGKLMLADAKDFIAQWLSNLS